MLDPLPRVGQSWIIRSPSFTLILSSVRPMHPLSFNYINSAETIAVYPGVAPYRFFTAPPQIVSGENMAVHYDISL